VPASRAAVGGEGIFLTPGLQFLAGAAREQPRGQPARGQESEPPPSKQASKQASKQESTTTDHQSPGDRGVRPGLRCKPCCAGSRGLPDRVRTPNRATVSRRETATSPPAPSSQCNVFTRSESQGQGPSHGQLSCAMKAGRVEKRVMCCVAGDSINDEDHCVVPELSQPLVWTCNMRYVTG